MMAYLRKEALVDSVDAVSLVTVDIGIATAGLDLAAKSKASVRVWDLKIPQAPVFQVRVA